MPAPGTLDPAYDTPEKREAQFERLKRLFDGIPLKQPAPLFSIPVDDSTPAPIEPETQEQPAEQQPKPKSRWEDYYL
jgi:hypothetical protein